MAVWIHFFRFLLNRYTSQFDCGWHGVTRPCLTQTHEEVIEIPYFFEIVGHVSYNMKDISFLSFDASSGLWTTSTWNGPHKSQPIIIHAALGILVICKGVGGCKGETICQL